MSDKLTYSNPRLAADVHNWPLGRNDRGTAHFEIETVPGKGQRAIRVTRHPLTGKAFAPKKRGYHSKVRIVDGSDGRTYIAEWSLYGFFEIAKGDMKYTHENIFETDERFQSIRELFNQNGEVAQ